MIFGALAFSDAPYAALEPPGVKESSASISCAASASSSSQLIASRGATANPSATVSAIARRVPLGSVLINGTSQTSVNSTGNGSRIRESAATANGVATTIDLTEAFRYREGSATATVAASNSASGVYLISADASTTAIASVSASSVRFAGASASVASSASTQGAAENVRTAGGQASAISSNSCDAKFTAEGSALANPTCSTSASAGYVKFGIGLVSSTSVISSIAREKWEPIAATSVDWTSIPVSDGIWSNVA